MLVIERESPVNDWTGEVLGVDSNRVVVVREEVSAAGRCERCGGVEVGEQLDVVKELHQVEPGRWKLDNHPLEEVVGWSIGRFVENFGELVVGGAARYTQMKDFGVDELNLFGECRELTRDGLFTLWAYRALGVEGAREALAFDIPRATAVKRREYLVAILRDRRGHLFTDKESNERFFVERSDSAKSTTGSVDAGKYYRCQWSRARGGLAKRLGVFDEVVGPFFATAEGRLCGVRSGSFASVGCRSCEREICKECGGSSVQARYAKLGRFGLELGDFMRRRISDLVDITEGEIREILVKLVNFGFGDLSLGGVQGLQDRPSAFGYEVFVRDSLRGEVKGAILTELCEFSPPLVPGLPRGEDGV